MGRNRKDSSFLRQMLPLNQIETEFQRFYLEHPDKRIVSPEDLGALIRQYLGVDMQERGVLTEGSLIPDGFNVMVLKHLRYLPGCFHSHDFFEINCMVSGACTYHTLDKTVQIRSGDVVIFPPHRIHSIDVSSDSCILINILIRSGTFDRCFFGLFDQFDVLTDFWNQALYGTRDCSYLLCHCGEDDSITGCILRMYRESLGEKKYRSQMLDALLHVFLITLLQGYEQDMIMANPEKKPDDSKILRILHYMGQEYQTLTLSKLSENFHYSERQMSRVLKEYTGCGFGELIRDFRLKKAVSLLETSSLSIQSIAEAAGYTDVSHFYRVFRKKYHCTPIEYRNFHSS